jgi:type IV pilus assembly protein PilQ
MIVASDFNFYADAHELIAKESYRRISMDFRDASLKNILKIFSEQAGLNFIASQNVQDRTVTLYMDGVPLQEALSKIMSANNLKYDLDPGSNIFVVKEWGRPEVETITKIYPLRYARLKSSKLESAIAAGMLSGGSSASSSSSGSGASASGGDGGGSSTIEEAIKNVLTSNGKTTQDSRTNSLIITDIPSQFDVIDKVVALIDVPSSQVMIEVEMLDVSKGTIDQMGVNTSSSLMQLNGSAVPTKFPNFMWDGQDLSDVAIPDGGLTYGTLSAAAFSAVLDFLSTDSKTKFLARPRILTMSNETAEIKIETDEAVGTITITSGTGATASTTTTAERSATGVSLKVTPQIDPVNGDVTMFIQPIVSQARSSAIVVNGNAVKDVETRTSQTTLMVKDGETIVVGGLIKTNDDTVVTKMPFVGDIPIIGALFRHKNSTKQERELIVFITPHIVRGAESIFLAKTDKGPGVKAPVREQESRVVKKEEVDNMLERWEN